MHWQFGDYRLDEDNECLWQGEQRLALRPKTFELLRYLVEHADQLVSKDTLMQAIWADSVVVEGVLTTSIGELRKLFGETAKVPQYIATEHRRGYRFIAPVTVISNNVPAEVQPPLLLVGRASELTRLSEYYHIAQQGQRQIVFVTGAAGIGKTTLVDTFVSQITEEHAPWLAFGQCIELYGSGEAYLPLLEILDQFGRQSVGRQSVARQLDKSDLIALLKQHAPSWLLQLPGLIADADLEAIERRASGATRERMLRELAEAIEILTTEQMLVLILEDLHWSDVSTLDWLAYMAQRRQQSRLLIIATYRPMDAIAHEHPVYQITQELSARQQCNELSLQDLSQESVLTYIMHRLGAVFGAQELNLNKIARLLHQRSNGNPLFLTTMVDALAQERRFDSIEQGIPDNLRQLIDRQLGKLTVEEQRLLEAASVVGKEFSSASVAAGTEQSIEHVEELASSLAHRSQFILERDSKTWPDGTISAGYRFTHDLYRETAYERIPISRRIRWHKQIGQCLEKSYQDQTSDIAAELATHFSQSNDIERAIIYLRTAGENAAQLHAYQEACTYLQDALTLIAKLPDTTERREKELQIQVALSPALVANKGYAAYEVEQAYSRAVQICQQACDKEQGFPALWGLWNVYLVRAQEYRAFELAEQLLQLANELKKPEFLLEAHDAMAQSYCYLGELDKTHHHLEQALSIYDPQQHHALAAIYGEEDAGVACHLYMGWVLCLLGYPEQALEQQHKGLILAQKLSDPHSEAMALFFEAVLHKLRREGKQLYASGEKLAAIANEYDLPYWLSCGVVTQGWGLAEQGRYEEGLLQIERGIRLTEASGAAAARPFYIVPLAQVQYDSGKVDEALKTVNQGLDLCQSLGERHWQAELYRLKGLFLIDQQEEVEGHFQQSLTIAQKQKAKLWELRTTISLCRLWQQQNKHAQALDPLTKIHKWFSEGFEIPDLVEAKALLEELSDVCLN